MYLSILNLVNLIRDPFIHSLQVITNCFARKIELCSLVPFAVLLTAKPPFNKLENHKNWIFQIERFVFKSKSYHHFPSFDFSTFFFLLLLGIVINKFAIHCEDWDIDIFSSLIIFISVFSSLQASN